MHTNTNVSVYLVFIFLNCFDGGSSILGFMLFSIILFYGWEHELREKNIIEYWMRQTWLKKSWREWFIGNQSFKYKKVLTRINFFCAQKVTSPSGNLTMTHMCVFFCVYLGISCSMLSWILKLFPVLTLKIIECCEWHE